MAWMNLESIMLSEKASQRKTSTLCFHSHVESNEQNKLTNKTETDSLKTDLLLSEGREVTGLGENVKKLSKKEKEKPHKHRARGRRRTEG